MYCLHKHWVKDLKIYLLLPTYFENLCLAKHLSNHLMSKKPTFWTLLGIEFELLTGSSLAAFEAALAKESLLSGLRSLWASYSLCSVIGSVNLKNVNHLILYFQHSIAMYYLQNKNTQSVHIKYYLLNEYLRRWAWSVAGGENIFPFVVPFTCTADDPFVHTFDPFKCWDVEWKLSRGPSSRLKL